MDNVFVATEQDGSRWIKYEDFFELLNKSLEQSEDVQKNWLSPAENIAVRKRILDLERYCALLEKSIARMIEISDAAESCAGIGNT